jgi:superfamily II DNA or RNA helicase
VKGKHPRVSLISPSFSAKNHLQVLGRIHRNGAKSDAVQKILVAAGSIEENVMKAIERKLKNLETLHG